MNKNMRIHEVHEAFLAYGRKNLFCSAKPITKQIFMGTDWAFCLINPHIPHDLRITTWVNGENMRIMRIHEEGLFNGFYLPCIEMGMRSRPKHEADMREHEDDPHVPRGGWHESSPWLFLRDPFLDPTMADDLVVGAAGDEVDRRLT